MDSQIASGSISPQSGQAVGQSAVQQAAADEQAHPAVAQILQDNVQAELPASDWKAVYPSG